MAMPRELDGPRRDRQEKQRKAAPEERRETSYRMERETVDPSSVRETLSRGREKSRIDSAADQAVQEDLRRTFTRPEQPAPDGDITPDGDAADAGFIGEPAFEARPPGDTARARDTREASGTAKRKSRLRFTAEETPADAPMVSEKSKAARHRADKADAKLERARERLPTKRSLGVEKTFDENKGKMKRKLVFEEEVKSRRAHLKGSPVTRPVKAAGNAAVGYAHKKLREVEHENVGTAAAHKTELLAEGGLRSSYRRYKLSPYRKTERFEKKAARLHVKAAYHEALDANPKLKSNILSRMAQKRKIKRDYAKMARNAQKTAKRAKKTAVTTEKIAEKVVVTVSRHPIAFLVIGLLAFLLIYIMTAFSSCSNMAVDGVGTVMATSYLAPDADIDRAELSYTEWETDLQIEVGRAERTHPGYDEYRYSVDDIGHGPHELMAYLTARYEDFSSSAIEADLRGIFNQQYQLTYTEEVEIRTRTVTRTDPNTGESYEEEEQYEWRILNITLTAQSFTDVVMPRLDAEQMQRYSLLTRVKGNRQYVGSPFSFNWLPYVSDGYGWRLHPISGGKDYHKGVDIAVATGTEILAVHDGVVTFAGNNGDYGLVVMITGEKGVETCYAHCSQLLVTQGQSVKMGDVIAKVGSTGNSTGAHLHFEVLKNGQYLNPMYFAITNDDGKSFIPPGTPGGVDIPPYPGAPMDNARFAAMMEEAQKHLGKPYVFGASGPNTFDCSGFVSYVLSHSIYPGFGRTTAQGIYNICTPVLRANAQPGDLIFFTGTYNAGRPVTHIGLYIGNGMMIHAGKPVQYASTDTPYWTSHFYAFARLP
jgi:murein DD-endopeptidase MepM/ murein hydrolase activator NlpD